MVPLWKKRLSRALRHADPDAAIAGYLERLRQADLAGTPPPPSALNGIGDAYLDKDDVASAIDYYHQAADAYSQAGLHDHAIACCRKIQRHAPEDGGAGLLLARSYASKGLRADALVELEALADRQLGSSDRRAALDALREITRLAPDQADRREELARLLLAEGQREAAVGEYRAAASAYVARGDGRAAERVRGRLAELEGAATGGTSVTDSPMPTSSREPLPRSAPPLAAPARVSEPAASTRDVSTDPAASLEIEHTSYRDQEEARAARTSDDGGVEVAGIRVDSPSGDDLRPRERAALAEAYLEAGREDEAVRSLALAAQGFRRDRRWTDAADMFRRLTEIGGASADHFAAWSECARQTGEPSRVLESLSAASRWYLQRGDRLGARRSAEEMLLIDPQNATASEILDRVGPALPLD